MTNKHYILCLVGLSGCGKTTISRLLEDNGIPSVVSYTTRPMRKGEVQGVEHFFITEQEYNDNVHVPEHSEYAAYTEIGGYRYFTTMDQLIEHDISTYVVDECGLLMLYSRVEQYMHQYEQHQFRIIPINIVADTDVIAARTDIKRRLRDEMRKQLDMSAFDIIVHNDAPNIEALTRWCEVWSIALRALVKEERLADPRPIHLNTRDTEVACVINQMSGVRYHKP